MVLLIFLNDNINHLFFSCHFAESFEQGIVNRMVGHRRMELNSIQCSKVADCVLGKIKSMDASDTN